MTYLPVIGLEIHVQVKTKSKMFCRCSSEYFGSDANSHVCPVCMGLPGALPVPNKAAFEKVIKFALALNSKINQETKFDRKNYFYPDLPKGYQISQYDQPIGEEGFVEIEVESDSRRVRIQRVHLEEDTGKSLHQGEIVFDTLGNPIKSSSATLLDYNKSGVPLMEIVTYPDFESTEEVILFAKRLKQIVRYLDVSDAEMQKGQMRFELNMSLKPDSMPAGELPDYKVEVKNIGSISVLEKVINFEFDRQKELLEKGEKIQPQTRGLKGMSGETLFQRSKETADDYRYFPEPDIPPIQISDDQIEFLKASMPELPHEKKAKYMNLGLEGEQADIFVEDFDRGGWFDKALEEISNQQIETLKFAKEVAKWVVGDLFGQLERRSLSIAESPVTQYDIIYLARMVSENKISGSIAKNVIDQIFDKGERAESIVTSQNLVQISDSSEIDTFIKQAIDENPKLVSDLAKNPNVIKALVGQVMKLSKGKVNPKTAEEKLQEALGNHE